MARKRTSHSFNYRLQLALEAGCKQETRIAFGSPKEAIRFRYEINALRASMRDANRSGWQRYYEAGVYISPSEPNVVTIKPKIEEFKDALDAAGIPDILAPPATPTIQQSDLDKMMWDLMKDLPKAE